MFCVSSSCLDCCNSGKLCITIDPSRNLYLVLWVEGLFQSEELRSRHFHSFGCFACQVAVLCSDDLIVTSYLLNNILNNFGPWLVILLGTSVFTILQKHLSNVVAF